MRNEVILVDKSDVPVGRQEKLRAHETGLLHRAFSVFLFDRKGRWLLQQRHQDKYHSAGLWSNTCCSHPQPDEETVDAAHDRLRMEMGIETPLTHAFQFYYRATFDNALTEHELDHVFLGQFDGNPVPHPAEVSAWRWITTEALLREMASTPDQFTVWFREAIHRVIEFRHASETCGA